MWLYIPTALSTSAPVPACSDWPLNLPLAEEYAPFVTSKGTPTQRPLSWRGWKTKPWIRRLSGMMYTVSQAHNLALSWIQRPDHSALLRATPANHFHRQECALVKTMTDIYGPVLLHSLSVTHRNCVFSRMSPDTLNLDSTQSIETWNKWVILLQQDCLQRRRLALPTRESGFSFWGTPNTGNGIRGALKPNGRRGLDIQYQALFWDMPKTSVQTIKTLADVSLVQHQNSKTVGNTHNITLWPTTRYRDYQGQTQRGTAKPTESLPNASEYHYLHLHQMTPQHGQKSCPSHRVLNPQFVEMLMGWPIGWTDCDSPVTGYAHWQRLMLSSLWRLLLFHNHKNTPNIKQHLCCQNHHMEDV